MTVRKPGAILAISALVLLSVATGSTAAHAAPNPPTVDQLFPDPWIVDHGAPAIQGNMDLGIVRIDIEASSDGGATYSPFCTVVTDPAATVWSCSTPTGMLSLGTNLVRAIATDGVPESSAAGPPISITRVNGPTISSPADDLYTNDYQPTFSGTSEGSYFDVYTSDFAIHFCGGTVVNLTWNCTATTIPDGDYTYLVESAYGATTLFSGYRTIHIDTVAPFPPSINLPVNPVDSSPAPTIYGIADEGSTIELFVDGMPADCSAGPIDYTGSWSCTLLDELTAGPHALTAIQTDQAGNASAVSSAVPLIITDTTPPAPPVVTSPLGVVSTSMNLVITNSTGATVTGTGEPGATLFLFGNICMMVPTIVDASGNWSCQLTTPMTPDGSYDVHFGLTDVAGNSSALTSPYLSFLVDTVAPGVPAVWSPTGPLSGDGLIQVTTAGTRPVITGMGEIGATVRIYDGASPVSCLESPLISGAGGFSCTVSSALSPGVHRFGFSQTDEAGNSSGAPVPLLQFTVLAPPAPPVPAAPPTASAAPPATTIPFSWILDFLASSNEVLPGQNVTLTAGGLPPGATVTAELHSTPVFLGTTTVKPDGSFILDVVIPSTVEPGDHHYVVTVTPEGGSASTAARPVTIMTAAVTEDPAPAPAPSEEQPTGGTGNPGTGGSRAEPASQNSLSQALPTLQQIIGNPVVIGAAAASSLALLFLVAFPAELLNSTIDENYERLFGRVRKPRLPWLSRLRERVKKAPFVGGLALTTLAALIFSFSDPLFGFDLASLRLFLACTIGMFLLGYVANALTGTILKRRWSIGSLIELKPAGLVVALLGVVLSRLLDFAPGLLIGLVLGLSLSASATLREESRSVLIWAGIVLGLSLACWVVYSFASGTVAPDTFGGALFDDTLVAVTTEGISGLVIGLLPIGYLDGASVFRHSKVQWISTYLVALVAFFVVVVPSGELWGDIQGPFWVWLTVLSMFAAVCVGSFLYFRLHRAKPGEELPDTQSGDPALEPALPRPDGN